MDIPFSDWLNVLMNKRGLTQAALARASGLSRQAISYYLSSNSKSPDDDALQKIAHALHLQPEMVLRAAGKLPPISETNQTVEQINYVVVGLPPDEQINVLEYALLRQRLAEEKETWNATSKTQQGSAPSGN